MNCDECKNNLATVHLTQMVNGMKNEMHLCATCAAQKGALMFDSSQFNIPNLLGSFLGGTYTMQNVTSQPGRTMCPNCGVTFVDIRQTGKLGCAECYKAFESELEPALRRIHGNSQHVGKVPVRSGEKVRIKRQIEDLKARMQQAVAEEDYEKAAEIRDVMKNIEKKLE